MESRFPTKYSKQSDKELVDRIIDVPHDDEAAAYLLQIRYAPLFRKIYHRVFNNDQSLYEDCIQDLFIYLKGKDLNWNKFRTFEWKSSLGAWLDRIAYNRFRERKQFLIGKPEKTIYIDDDHKNGIKVLLQDMGEQEYEKHEMHVLLMEAVGMLKDPDQKLVVIKRLQGYNSKDIALLLQKRWEKHNIVKYNNKKQMVVPDAAYVDVRMQRAKDNLEIILKKVL